MRRFDGSGDTFSYGGEEKMVTKKRREIKKSLDNYSGIRVSGLMLLSNKAQGSRGVGEQTRR